MTNTTVDFSFYVAVSHDMGLRLFDIKYKGKRIIYEVCSALRRPKVKWEAHNSQLGMEEAIAHYA